MQGKNLFSNIQLLTVRNFTSAAATGIIETTVVDSKNYEGVFAVAQLGTTSTANGLRALHGTASASAGLSQVLNSYVEGVSTGNMLDIHRPKKRFLQFQCMREASSKLGSIFVFGYGPRVAPTTNSTAGLSAGRALFSPETGTASSTA